MCERNIITKTRYAYWWVPLIDYELRLLFYRYQKFNRKAKVQQKCTWKTHMCDIIFFCNACSKESMQCCRMEIVLLSWDLL